MDKIKEIAVALIYASGQTTNINGKDVCLADPKVLKKMGEELLKL